jgi:hypothetical protein
MTKAKGKMVMVVEKPTKKEVPSKKAPEVEDEEDKTEDDEDKTEDDKGEDEEDEDEEAPPKSRKLTEKEAKKAAKKAAATEDEEDGEDKTEGNEGDADLDTDDGDDDGDDGDDAGEDEYEDEDAEDSAPVESSKAKGKVKEKAKPEKEEKAKPEKRGKTKSFGIPKGGQMDCAIKWKRMNVDGCIFRAFREGGTLAEVKQMAFLEAKENELGNIIKEGKTEINTTLENRWKNWNKYDELERYGCHMSKTTKNGKDFYQAAEGLFKDKVEKKSKK